VNQTGQPYAYTGDDPVNLVDPLGLSWYDPSWAHKAAHDVVSGLDTARHAGAAAADVAAAGVRNYDPAYKALQAYDNEYHAAQDGCSLLTDLKYASEAVGWDVATFGILGGGAGADAVEEGGAAAQAAALQGSGAYPGVDAWENVTLKAGTIVHAGEPGLTGFATSDAAAASVGNDATALNEGLQVASRAGSYRPGLTAFQLTQDVQAASSLALANPAYGAGGLEQFFIPGFSDVTEPLVTQLMFPGGAP
jgi:hypothetical protein